MRKRKRDLCIGLALLAAGALLLGSDAPSSGIGRMTAEIVAGGISLGRFVPLNGPSVVVELLTVEEGGATRKAPGLVRVEPILFEAGIAPSPELLAWRREVIASGAGAKRDGRIILYDDAGKELARFDFVGGWPSRMEGFRVLRAGFMGRVVDLLELSVDWIERANAPGAGGSE